jgi:hypothetical protein
MFTDRCIQALMYRYCIIKSSRIRKYIRLSTYNVHLIASLFDLSAYFLNSRSDRNDRQLDAAGRTGVRNPGNNQRRDETNFQTLLFAAAGPELFR